MGTRALARLDTGSLVAGRYQVRAHVGSGGMGDVYEVEHQLLGRRFALKRLAPELGADPAMVERFLREARAAAATHHPHVVEVVDSGFADEGWPFLVMERLVGETVRDRLRRGPLPVATAIEIARQVLDALAAAHAVGVVHRDIKPENLWLCRDPGVRVKVLDFGLALLVSGDRTDLRLTQSGAVLGTPLYMSPEQARGLELDGRSDLYAVGAVLYEMVTGRPPFHAEAYSVLVAMILEDPAPTAPLAGLDAGLRAVIERALAKRRDDRFADAMVMRAALAAVIGEADDAGGDARAGDDVATIASAANAPRVITAAPTVAAKLPASALAAPPVASLAAVESAPTLSVASAETVPDAAAIDAPTEPLPSPPSMPPALVVSVTPAPVVSSLASPPRAPRVAGLWIVVALIAIASIAVAIAIAFTNRGHEREPPIASRTAAPAREGSGSGGAWRPLLERGELQAAADEAAREALRNPDAGGLLARALLLQLIADRPAAYARADVLRDRREPPMLAAALAATDAMKRGLPADGADALAGPLRAATAGDTDELLVRVARGSLYRTGDRFDLARAEYEAILARRPAYAPAVEALVERLCFFGDDASLAAAQRIVDAYVAAAPDSPDLELRVAEVALGERRYRDALDRLDRIQAAGPARDVEITELRGDLHLLLGDVDGAIAVYDGVDDRNRRAEYIAAALLHADRKDEAARLYRDTIIAYPARGKQSRLGKLVFDAALLALRDRDAALAGVAAGALPAGDIETPAASARAFALAVQARLADRPIDPAAFPEGARSPAFVLVDAWGRADAGRADLLRDATDPEHERFGVVTTHVYPPLELVAATAEAAAGDRTGALARVDRIVRPSHYDTSRGVVLGPALELRARLLDALGRGGEAAATRRELAALHKP